MYVPSVGMGDDAASRGLCRIGVPDEISSGITAASCLLVPCFWWRRLVPCCHCWVMDAYLLAHGGSWMPAAVFPSRPSVARRCMHASEREGWRVSTWYCSWVPRLGGGVASEEFGLGDGHGDELGDGHGDKVVTWLGCLRGEQIPPTTTHLASSPAVGGGCFCPRAWDEVEVHATEIHPNLPIYLPTYLPTYFPLSPRGRVGRHGSSLWLDMRQKGT